MPASKVALLLGADCVIPFSEVQRVMRERIAGHDMTLPRMQAVLTSIYEGKIDQAVFQVGNWGGSSNGPLSPEKKDRILSAYTGLIRAHLRSLETPEDTARRLAIEAYARHLAQIESDRIAAKEAEDRLVKIARIDANSYEGDDLDFFSNVTDVCFPR